jgi:phospholipid N-methyltransferase
MGPLRKKLEQNEDYQLLKDNVQFFEGLVQELPEDVEYDIIISALPFLNFEVSTVEDIFSKLSRLSKRDTTLAYYEYIGLRNLGKLLPIPQRRERINALDKFFREQSFARPAGKEQVWYNILPINVYRMHMIDLERPNQSPVDGGLRQPESSVALSSQ